MTKADIVDQISERTGLTKKDVAETVDCFLNAVAKALSEGHHIEIRGFGTFRVKDRKSRIARNPRTGEAVPVPPRRVPVFKVSKELKDMVSQQWTALQGDAERAWARTESVLLGPPARPATERARGFDTIGMLCMGRGLHERARRMFERAAEAAPNASTV
ncbi:MAG: HU family DNA-binding protein, partial [bacterium]